MNQGAFKATFFEAKLGFVDIYGAPRKLAFGALVILGMF